MKKEEMAICPNCEWTGDAFGIVSCPQCGGSLVSLDGSGGDPDLEAVKEEKYPTDVVKESRDDVDLIE